MGFILSRSCGITRISIVLNSLRCDGSTVARQVMDNALRVGTSVSRSECRMISVKVSNGRLGDWSETILVIVEVEDTKRLPVLVPVRYPTCLRTEIDSNTISISARHPNSEIRISITHRLVDNPTTSGPYDKTTCPDLSIYCAIIPIHLCHIFMTRSALVS